MSEKNDKIEIDKEFFERMVEELTRLQGGQKEIKEVQSKLSDNQTRISKLLSPGGSRYRAVLRVVWSGKVPPEKVQLDFRKRIKGVMEEFGVVRVDASLFADLGQG